MVKIMELFECLKTIISGKKADISDIEKINPYVLCRWLSGDPRSIMIANALNANADIPVERQYEFAKYLLAHKIKYLRYYSNTKLEGEDLENIAKYYNISLEKAQEYASLISSDEIAYINSLYRAN